MEPVTLVVTALAAGAALGLEETTSAAVKDAYARLKVLAARRLGSRPDGERALDRHAGGTTGWEQTLAAELAAAGAGGDHDLVTAAQAVLRLAGEAGWQPGKYLVDLWQAQGVQVGDRNTQHNTFGAAPGC